MKNEFKNAFEDYYSKLETIYKITFETLPTIFYDESDEEIDKDMICSEPNEDKECEWKLKEIIDLNFDKIEEEFGFKICDELKAYYSTYLFLHLAGEYEDIDLNFDIIKSKEHLEKKILVSKKDGDYYFENSEVFVLGSANYKNNDAYVIFYDNKSSEVFIYENDTDNKIILKSSLLEIIKNMKASF